MENLEKYIQDNLEQFNKGEMPAGHQERFLAKLFVQTILSNRFDIHLGYFV